MKSTDGLFLLADHGTMFLDEITDMSPSLQAKLLRVLETGEVKPLGQPAIRKVDVRVVCATNKDLEQEMLLGRFREDLYYRLKVVSIRLPSLGERREDIPLLAAHFLNKYSKQFDQKIRGFTEDSLAFLCLRDWPGNVRELEHVIEAAVALSPSRVLDKGALWLAQGRSPSIPDSPPTGLSLSEACRSLERRYVTRALRETGWNVSAASRNLGISRRQLQRLMRRYELGRGRPSVSIRA